MITTKTQTEPRLSTRAVILPCALMLMIALGGCSPPSETPSETESASPSAPPTNRIPLGAAERANLGVTWAQARRERLEKVRDVPAEIIPWPGHSWTLRSPGEGLVLEALPPWRPVTKGMIVARIASSSIADGQSHLGEADQRRRHAALERRRLKLRRKTTESRAGVLEDAARQARASLDARSTVLQQLRVLAVEAKTRADEMTKLRREQAVPEATRLSARRDAVELSGAVMESEQQLRTTRIRAAEHESNAAQLRIQLDTIDEELDALDAAWRSADSEFRSHLAAFAALCGHPAEELARIEEGRPAWTAVEHIALRAPAEGIVSRRLAAPGTQVDASSPLLELLDPSVVGLRAQLPESDAGRMPTTPEVQLLLPGSDEPRALRGALIRPVAEAATRRIIVEAPITEHAGRARPGGSAGARILMSRGKEVEVLVPSACVVEDGLDRIVFRRDPANPDQVIRTEVVVGDSSGGWTEIIAGVGGPDELVLNGARQLREAGQGASTAGGHFHADGTWHEGDH